jgi:hypothetical protein
MKIHKLHSTFENIINTIDEDPQKGFDTYQLTITDYDYQDRSVLFHLFEKYLAFKSEHQSTPTTQILSLLKILVDLDMQLSGDSPIGSLTLGLGIKDVQIAKLFYDLKNSGVILSTYEEIANVISKIFGLKNKTLMSYLTNKKKMQKAKPLFKI